MISYGKQRIDQNDIDAVVNVLKRDWLTQGPNIENFEIDLKTFFGAKHCCTVANGTAALHLTGIALGWQHDDIVITSPITFLATANCIVYAGATPDFVDIDLVSHTIDPNQLEDKLKAYQFKGKKVKAVIGVDYAGHPCDWKELRNLADKYDLQLVNDNCHAMGASFYDDKQYAVKYADVVTQSYHPVKNFTTGEGGAILTNDPEIDKRVKCLRSHGMTKDTNQLWKNDGLWYYEMHEVGYNYRITDFQCALGISQLKKLDSFVKKRREKAHYYNKFFFEKDFILIPGESVNVHHAYHLYPLQIKFAEAGIDKKKLFEDLKRNDGIKLQVHYIPVHLQPYYQKNYGYGLGAFPNAEQFYRNELSLPIYPDLLTEQQQQVMNSVIASIVS